MSIRNSELCISKQTQSLEVCWEFMTRLIEKAENLFVWSSIPTETNWPSSVLQLDVKNFLTTNILKACSFNKKLLPKQLADNFRFNLYRNRFNKLQMSLFTVNNSCVFFIIFFSLKSIWSPSNNSLPVSGLFFFRS